MAVELTVAEDCKRFHEPQVMDIGAGTSYSLDGEQHNQFSCRCFVSGQI